MKKIILEIPERILLIGIFNDRNLKGDIETLKAVLDDIPKISLSEDLKKEIGFEEVKDELGNVVSFKWDKPESIEVELNEKTINLVINYIKEKSDAKLLTVADHALIVLNDKLKDL